MTRWKTTRALGCAAFLFALCHTGGDLRAHEPVTAPEIKAQHVATEPLAGNPDKEIDIKIYTFPPNSATPWHIHQDSVEIAHILAGSILLERTGEPPFEVSAGDTNILPPNVIHRGWNPSSSDAATLYVVRIKPKGTPLATLVPAPDQAAEAPPGSSYPEDE